MQATRRTLNDIFAPSVRLVAPLFQRPYVWNRDSNWLPLWESIRDLADRRLQGITSRPHFLGAVVLHQLYNPIGDIGGREIIDGQQRLTTLQVFIAAMRDLCGQVQLTDYQGALAGWTRNNTPGLTNPDHAFKVWPTNADQEQFRSVIKAGSPFAIYHTFRPGATTATSIPGFGLNDDQQVRDYLLRHSGWGREERAAVYDGFSKTQRKEADLHIDGLHKIGGLLPKAYLYFYAVLVEWLGDPSNTAFQQRIQALYQTLNQDILLVVIDLGSNDDPQQIFETMNALGTPLLPADLVKNFLFRAAVQQQLNVDQLYTRHWQIFDDKDQGWREKMRQGRLLRPRIDLFLQHYLTLSTGEEVPVTDLFGVYKGWASGKQQSADQLIAHFRRYADIYARFESFPANSREALFFTRMARLDTSTVFPLMLEVFHRHTAPGTDAAIREIMVDLESYLVRRAVCGLSPKNYNRLFRGLIQNHTPKDSFSPDAIRQYLLKQTADTARWPDDGEFRKAWMERPLYKVQVQQRTRMILKALERQLQTALTNSYQITGTISIEHLMPQAWEKHWPLPTGVSVDDATRRRNNLIHTIGNLTIVTKSLNPKLSNGAWDTKQPAILKNNGLNLNRDLPVTWDEDTIEARGAELFKAAKAIWPYPA